MAKQNSPLFTPSQQSFRQLYIMMSIFLAVPIILLPINVYIPLLNITASASLDFWLLLALILLIVSSVSDSLLGGMRSTASMSIGVMWMSTTIMIGSQCILAPQAHFILHGLIYIPDGSVVLASLFALHGLRHAPMIWQREITDWWAYPAWIRDNAIAVTMFGWLYLLSY
ncbi:MAG: hypothetical protein Q9M28_11155 [Mariprofundaceae bacterium]|nr:hypothetical protein [Mariprofundaceae bacterium]